MDAAPVLSFQQSQMHSDPAQSSYKLDGTRRSQCSATVMRVPPTTATSAGKTGHSNLYRPIQNNQSTSMTKRKQHPSSCTTDSIILDFEEIDHGVSRRCSTWTCVFIQEGIIHVYIMKGPNQLTSNSSPSDHKLLLASHKRKSTCRLLYEKAACNVITLNDRSASYAHIQIQKPSLPPPVPPVACFLRYPPLSQCPDFPCTHSPSPQ